jgi:hypothetical protein
LKTFRLAPVVLLTALLAPRVSHAETPPPASAQDGARRHFAAGVALYEDRNYEAALVEFEAARAQSNEPVILYNVGLCQRSLFRYTDAIATFSRYLEETAADSRVTPAQRKEVTAAIAEMTALLADVTITVQPESAATSASLAISIDGRPGAGRDRPNKLAAGRHVIEISAGGFTPARREIIVVAGVAQSVALSLDPVPPPTAFTAPPSRTPAVTEGAVADLTATPTPTRSTPLYGRWWFWTGVGVVLAGGVTTVLLLTRSRGPDLVNGTLYTKMIPP